MFQDYIPHDNVSLCPAAKDAMELKCEKQIQISKVRALMLFAISIKFKITQSRIAKAFPPI
jgi:hypothetical protein